MYGCSILAQEWPIYHWPRTKSPKKSGTYTQTSMQIWSKQNDWWFLSRKCFQFLRMLYHVLYILTINWPTQMKNKLVLLFPNQYEHDRRFVVYCRSFPHVFLINIFEEYHIDLKETYGLPCIFRYSIKKCNILRTSVTHLGMILINLISFNFSSAIMQPGETKAQRIRCASETETC